MEKITSRTGRGIPVRGNDIDTDRIIPARYMKSVTFAGLGEYAFFDERYTEDGSLKEHVMNNPKFDGASIMVVNKNFGCGSSREHAPQALKDYGISALIGESFAEIFAGNCTAMGIPVVTSSSEAVEKLQSHITADSSSDIELDLKDMAMRAGGFSAPIGMPETYRKALLDGSWDSTSLLLSVEKEIDAVEQALHYRFN